MSGMDEYLAAAYGSTQTNTAAAGDPDAEKVAQAQMFAKLASDNGIDLNKLSDADVHAMWSSYSAKLAETSTPAAAAKVAEFPPKKEEKEEKKEEKEHGKAPPFGKKDEHEKEAAARSEFNAQREWTQKVAEADFLGRHMAKAFHAQLQEDAGVGQPAAGENKEAAAFVAMLKEGQKKVAEFPPKKEEKKDEKHEDKHEDKEEKKDHPFPFGKKASVLDEVAANVALALAVKEGYKAEEIGPKLAAVLVLGAPQSTKLAAAQDYDQAREVRALELLEAIGFKIDWVK